MAIWYGRTTVYNRGKTGIRQVMALGLNERLLVGTPNGRVSRAAIRRNKAGGITFVSRICRFCLAEILCRRVYAIGQANTPAAGSNSVSEAISTAAMRVGV